MAEKDPAADDQLELKKRARRRLVGAVALALAAVIVLPMVMDSEPRPSGQDIQVRIPSQDGEGFASRVLPGNKTSTTPLPPLSEGKDTTPGPVPSALPLPPSDKTEKLLPSVVPPLDKVSAPVDKAVTEPKGPVSPASTPKPETKAEPVKAPAATKQAESKTVEKAPARVSEEARASAALAGKPSPVTAGQWVVQLGAYQNGGNVKLLLAKIKEMNIPAYTEKTDTPQGSRIRVRAGPFASKDAAEKAQARIRKIGVDGPVAQK